MFRSIDQGEFVKRDPVDLDSRRHIFPQIIVAHATLVSAVVSFGVKREPGAMIKRTA
ncbi:hypothetical protein X992_4547 [Burkholderia pseudomallei MSHR5492]|nr:hypothetical protein X992_4547 [Burkholderia pseudomallei MSHR5492]